MTGAKTTDDSDSIEVPRLLDHLYGREKTNTTVDSSRKIQGVFGSAALLSYSGLTAASKVLQGIGLAAPRAPVEEDGNTPTFISCLRERLQNAKRNNIQ